MRVLITGDRFWTCRRLAAGILRRFVERFGRDIVIVHGCGCGVEQCFQVAAAQLGITQSAVEKHVAKAVEVLTDWMENW